ncbi:MAG: DUF4340 domain-containing protein [Candidatus Cyclobacteriaceae bacterium M3_2C_046]
MFKKISNITLIGILVALVLLYLGIQFLGKSDRSKSFREELVEIDTSKVTELVIQADTNAVHLIRQEGDWKIKLASGKMVDAEDQDVISTLNNLLTIKPSRIATRSEEKWSDYQVDTAGTQIQIYEGKHKTLDLIVGRFGINQSAMQQQQQQAYMGRGMQQFYTYVRLAEEEEVYAADDFMGMSLSTQASNYRNTQLISFTLDSLTQVSYQYPADSSFALRKADSGQWVIQAETADSAAVADYLRNVRYQNATNFADELEASDLATPDYQMTLEIKGEENVQVEAFRHPRYNWVIHSSLNPDNYFADQQGEIIQKIFTGKQRLLTPRPA